MNHPIPDTLPAPRTGLKPLALLGAALVLAAALLASRFSPSPTPTAAAAEETSEATARAVKAAKAFLEGLDDKQREKALYDFNDKKKPNWSNLPVTFVPRNGVRMGDLNKEQRALALAVVASVLSKEGYQKVVDIVDADQKLAEGGGGKGPKGGKDKGGKDKGPKDKGGKGPKGGGPNFGADQYYLAIFGKPSATEGWMVQYGGHHLAINVTVIGKHFVLTPTHTAAQPSSFKRGDKEVRPLGQENDAGFRLVNSLDEKQRKQAIIGERPQGELLLGPGRDGKKIDPAGIKGSELTAKQKAILLEVIGAWVNVVEPASAKARMKEIEGDVADTYFAWKGPTEKGSAAYFRVQGPSVVIEYAPQGGTDHIHTVVRNPKDDYGAAWLKR